jgi:ferredoxin
MAFVITRLCVDCVDGACVDTCPVDCIVQEKPDAGLGLPKQLFIQPDDCIDCACCEMACPVDAIFHEGDVPAKMEEDIATNAKSSEMPRSFEVPKRGPRR